MIRRYHFLETCVDVMTLEDILEAVASGISAPGKSIIGHQNLHSVYLIRTCRSMRHFYQFATRIHIDGMALVWIARILGHPVDRRHRVTWVDLIHPLMEEAERSGWRVFFLGSSPGVGTRAVEVLRSEYPNLEIAALHGYFDAHSSSRENHAVLTQINEYKPDVLLVGMGMPRQEGWVVSELQRIDARVIMTCGAVMDYIAGTVPTPPRWMGSIGLEWLYRLVGEPRRLFRRYLIEPWFVLPLFLKELRSRR
jgi:N-acetylglucosaminyldiphosphoundecaprenol N-acetyl-beta-D-mannosaminyltransferase